MLQNIRKIINTLERQGMKITEIAHAMGYSTTTQLHNLLDGKSNLSIKAAVNMIDNLNVSPRYLFNGKDEMFIRGESTSKVDMIVIHEREMQDMRAMHQQEMQVKIDELIKTAKTVQDLKRKVKKLEDRNDCVIELAMTSLKYYKAQK